MGLILQCKPHNLESEWIGALRKKKNSFFVEAESFDGKKANISLSPDKLKLFFTPSKHMDNTSEIESAFQAGDILHIYPDGKLVRRYSNGTNDMTIFLSDACNQNCLICPQASPGRRALDRKYAQKENLLLVKAMLASNAKVIGISGGEPLCHLSELLEIIELINRKSPDTHIDILTNGTLLADPKNVLKFKSICHKNLSFHVPLYSDSERIHNEIVNAENFHNAIKGIYNLAKCKYPVEIRNVINKINYKRLPQWADFVAKNFPFVAHVAAMGLELEGNAKNSIDEFWVEPGDFMEKLESAAKIFKRAEIPFSVYNYPLCFLSEKLMPYYAPSVSDWKQTYAFECSECARNDICCGMFNNPQYTGSPQIKPFERKNDDEAL